MCPPSHARSSARPKDGVGADGVVEVGVAAAGDGRGACSRFVARDAIAGCDR
jgi:hypothetical protein